MVKFVCIAFLPLIFGCRSHKNEPLEKLTVGTPSKTMVVNEMPGPPAESIFDTTKKTEILLIDDAKPIEFPKEQVPTEGSATSPQDTSNQEVLQIAEQMPEFPGGQNALMAWLQKNLEYPEEAKEQGIEGRVFVQFNVYSTGVCGNFTVLKSPSPILSNAALKTLKKMPKWTPGMQNGKVVNTVMRLPISYKLQ
jgi:protein TonB